MPQIIVEQSDMPLEENISSSSARRDSAEDISSFPASRDSAKDISSFPASRDSAKNISSFSASRDSAKNISSFSASRDSAKNISSFPASRDSAKVPCLAPIKHNKQRRKKDHDYTAISLYLITVTTTNRQRLLGTLLGNSAEAATIEATDIGKMVIACFKRIPEITKQKTGCRVQVVQYQLMPDHFHGILYVQDELPKEWPLGQIISGWKGACTRAYNALISSFPARRDSAENSSSSPASRDSAKKTPLFNPGYNDRILNQYGQLEGWIQYLRDNPRRLWLKIHFPDRLRKIYEFTAGKQSHRYTAVGDTFLVKYPERIQVRCHRNLSEDEIQKEVKYYLTLARNGVVLVSPFISPAERAVYEACYREKLKMIRIVNRGMDNQFVYPSGRDLQGCSDGFMLILAPYVENSNETRAARISRATCLDMNGYAADLSTFTLSREAENELKKESAPE